MGQLLRRLSLRVAQECRAYQFDQQRRPAYGADLRWYTPLRGLLVGISRTNQHDEDKGTFVPFWNPAAGKIPYWEYTRPYWLNQYYGAYSKGRRRLGFRVSPHLH